MALAEEDQEAIEGLPDGAQVPVHLNPDVKLSWSSHQTIVGRLDEKERGGFVRGLRSDPICRVENKKIVLVNISY